MADDTTDKVRSVLGTFLPGVKPEVTKSGARIYVSSSGTTSVEPSALSEIARRRFREMRLDTELKKQTG